MFIPKINKKRIERIRRWKEFYSKTKYGIFGYISNIDGKLRIVNIEIDKSAKQKKSGGKNLKTLSKGKILTSFSKRKLRTFLLKLGYIERRSGTGNLSNEEALIKRDDNKSTLAILIRKELERNDALLRY